MLDENPLRAWYGEGHVLKAAERGAISKLLVSDELFRYVAPRALVLCLSVSWAPDRHCSPAARPNSAPSVARRRMFVKLVEDVKAYGGEVLMFSSMHESGQRESRWHFNPWTRRRLRAAPGCGRAAAFHPVLARQSALTGSLAPSPAELNQLTGIAALLSFPLDIEVIEEEERVEAEERQPREQAEDESTAA